MRLPFEEEASEELEAVAQFYERERAGYGRLFLVEVSKKVARAADFPRSGTRVPGTAEDRDARAFVLSAFPYTVVTAIVTGRRAVVAVAHHHRRPGYWKDRLQ
jgi:plasmid stabilization system protein ParE